MAEDKSAKTEKRQRAAEERNAALARALRANLGRRKEQARARSVDAAPRSDGAEPPTDGDS